MNTSELAKRARALPDRFADRLDPGDLENIKNTAGGGEWTEEVDELLASLQQCDAPVTAEERDELQAVLDAIRKPDGTFDVPEDFESPQDRLNTLRVAD
jgi:hypothetical protein